MDIEIGIKWDKENMETKGWRELLKFLIGEEERCPLKLTIKGDIRQ